jgi:hypothetical protein
LRAAPKRPPSKSLTNSRSEPRKSEIPATEICRGGRPFPAAEAGYGIALRALARESFLNFAKNLVDFFNFLHLSREQADRQRDTVPHVMNRKARAIENGISVHSEQWYLIHNLWDIESDWRMTTTAAFGQPADAESKPADE